MNIGIITLPPHTNFGGILQAYALQTVFERMGHNVFIIDNDPVKKLSLREKMLCYPKRFILRYLFGNKNVKIKAEEYELEIRPIIRKNTDGFVLSNLHLYHVSSFKELSNNDLFDMYVVGSDQIWRPKFTCIENAFVGFDRRSKIRRISYAASFGVDTWEFSDEQTRICKELVKRFEFIGVREKNGVELCKKYLNVDAHQVIDPTLLLLSTDYIKLIKKANPPKSQGNMMVYILDPSPLKSRVINIISSRKKLNPFVSNAMVNDYRAALEERIQPSVESWLRGFLDSEVIVTDSFHACVFSILFHRKFLVIGNHARGLSRLSSLLETFGLQSHLIIENPQNNDIDIPPIDWSRIDETLTAKRKEVRNIFSSLKLDLS